MFMGDDYIDRIPEDLDGDAAALVERFINQWSRGTTFRSLDGRDRSELLTRMAQIVHAMANPEDYRAIAGRILEACLETVPADSAVLLVHNAQGKLAVTMTRGGEASDALLKEHGGIIQKVLRSRERFILEQEGKFDTGPGARQRCFFPVVSSRNLGGILFLDGVLLTEEREVPAAAQIWSGILGLLLSHSQLHHSKELLNGYLRNMQEKVIWFDKVAGNGRIAASAGHELNNLLSVLAGNLELAKSWLQAGEEPGRILERLGLLQDVVASAAQISQGLINPEPQEKQLQRCSMNSLVCETVELLKPLVTRRGARFDLQPGAELPDVLVDATQIRQVVRNLLLNAVEARSDVQIWIRLSHDPEAQRIKLAIRDNGPSIPAARIPALFSPMQAGQEKGLSLLICKEIIERHGGSLRFESEEGAGSEYTISLPQYGAETQLCWRKKINRSE